METIRGVIFDIDGTLVDSNDAHALAWVEAFAKVGCTVTFERVRPLIGMGADHILPMMGGFTKASPEGRQVARLRGEIFRIRYMTWVQALPGARDLVLRLRSDGIALELATSADAAEIDSLLTIANVLDLIDNPVSGAADPLKPRPRVVQEALDRLRLPADSVVLIGDTPYDIAAASDAGIEAIALRSGGWDDSLLLGARSIYDDPADLLSHYDESRLAVFSLQQAGMNGSASLTVPRTLP